MNSDDIKRQEHLALRSLLSLKEFCKKFTVALDLPEMDFDFENETEWGNVEVSYISYTVSRPYEDGTLYEWDNSIPKDCNFGITMEVHEYHRFANDAKWIFDNLIVVVANKLVSTFMTPIYYHRTWLNPGKNEIKNIIFSLEDLNNK
jgi:hypothetical protein